MEASLVHSYADQESMSHGKKARNPKRSIETHRSLIPSRTNVTTSNLYIENFRNMDHVMLNPPYPFPISSSSSSFPRHNFYPHPLQFQQPPLLPLPMASSSSSHGTNKKLYNKEQKNTKQAPIRPQKHSTHRTKKYPDLKPDLGSVGNTKRRGPDPESEPPKNVTREMNFYESLIFAMSPPPSSLPMPKFSILKPKLN